MHTTAIREVLSTLTPANENQKSRKWGEGDARKFYSAQNRKTG